MMLKIKTLHCTVYNYNDNLSTHLLLQDEGFHFISTAAVNLTQPLSLVLVSVPNLHTLKIPL